MSQELNFSSAATRLHMAQPPLSQQIKAIEMRLGIQIFERSTRSVRITPAGEQLIQAAKQVLKSHQTMLDALINIEAQPLKLGAIPLAFDAFLSDKIAHLKKEKQEIDVHLAEGNSQELIVACQNKRLDGAVVRLYNHPFSKAHMHFIKSEEYVAVYPKDWQLELTDDTVCLSYFNQMPYISYPRDLQPQLYDKIESAFKALSCSPVCVQQVNSKAVTMSLVSSGMGFAIVPKSTVKRYLDTVKYVPIKQSLPSVDYYLYCENIQSHSLLESLLVLLKKGT